MRRKTPLAWAALIGAILITGCAPVEEGDNAQSTLPTKPVGGDGMCDSDAANGLIGTAVDIEDNDAIDAELRALTGAAQTRWVPDGSAVTMDFRPDRLTISLDENHLIERISCG